MKILVKLSTTFRNVLPDYDPANGLVLDIPDKDIPDGISALDVAIKLGLPLTDIKVVMLNAVRVELDAAIKNGDRLAFFPPVGGG